MARVRVILLVPLVECLKPVLARIVLHGISGIRGVHVVIPDIGIGRMDGVKELLIIVCLHFPGRSLILDGREGGL